MDETGGTILSISDEEGNNYQIEHLCSLEHNGAYYMAFVPADIPETDERYGLLFMRSVEGDDGESYLETLTEEEEAEVHDKFMELLYGDEDEEDDPEE